jgi:hypothetical protein
LLKLESADERDDNRLGRSSIQASGNGAEAQGGRTDLESAVGDEEESPKRLEMERMGLLLRMREEGYMRTVLVLEGRRE